MALISFWWDIAIVLFIVCELAILWLHRRYKYWKKKGVQGPDPLFFYGNIKDMLTLKRNFSLVFMDMYNEFKQLPHFGIFMMHRPTLVINDLELIKTIFVKDFTHFSEHLLKFNPKYEPLSEHLFNASGEKWKSMRHKLTPTFTTNKMKYMFETMKNCNKDLSQYLEKTTKLNNDVNVKEIMSHFGMNVIASCAFGVQCDAFEDPNSKFIQVSNNIFYQNNIRSLLQMFMIFCLPGVANNLKFSLLGKETNDFFHNLVKDTIKHRNENNLKRNDFLQILMQLQEHGHIDDSGKGEKNDDDEPRLTTMQLAAQVFVFFLAGFETSSTTTSFALYELAKNPDIQEIVREEIKSTLKKHDEKITYESISEMTYLTQTIEETLRKYPPLPVLFRTCTKEYKLPNTDVVIEKGTPVMIPIYAIQRDAEYFPDPEKFDPERFTPENKASRHHFSYLPFGEGPRICIGSRFGMMQVKLGLISVLSNYKVSTCEKTLEPMKYNAKNFALTSESGIWLKLTNLHN